MKTPPRAAGLLILSLLLSIGTLFPVQARPPAPADTLPIRLVAGAFDPLVDQGLGSQDSSLRLSAYPGDGTGYYLVQFNGPIHRSDTDTLVQAGATVLGYIPDFTLVVKMDGAARTAVAGLPQVRWVGIYQPAYRLHPDLQGLAALARASASAPEYSGRLHTAQVGDDPIEVIAVLFPGEPLATIIGQIQGWGGTVLGQSQTEWKGKLRISISPARLSDLATIPGVNWIERAPEWELFNGVATDVMDVRDVWDTHGLRGQGQIVAVADSGLDRGSTHTGELHDDFEDGNGNSRVQQIFDLAGDGANDVNTGHGTHVAGSVLGNGDLSGADPAGHDYPSTSYAGAAPEATLVFQAIEINNTRELSIPNDLNDLFSQAAGAGAKLHNNSWGNNEWGAYSSFAQDADEYAWDHKDFTILFSAGNSGRDNDADGVINLYSVGPPATAKNVIAVGGSENNRPDINRTWGSSFGYPADPISDDRMADNPSGLAAFSSRGNTLDGRYKPDIVAPGTFVGSVLGQEVSCVTTCGWGKIDDNYMYFGGTSMATPLATGAATVLRQFYADTQKTAPSAALIKATLVNGATDLNPGQYGSGAQREIPGPRPTNVAGWGRVDVEHSIFPTPPRAMFYEDVTDGLSTGETDSYTFMVTDSAEPLRVTLAWTDFPGQMAAGGGLVNDLDLKMETPDGSFVYPNNAVQRGTSQDLQYASLEDAYLTTGIDARQAVRFTPDSYPVTLDKIMFYVINRYDLYPTAVDWYVYDTGDDSSGPTGSPVISGTHRAYEPGYHTVDVSGHGLTISGGDFFVAIDSSITGAKLLVDTTAVDQRTWALWGASWVKQTSYDAHIRAVVVGAAPTTPQDRNNNLVGIDLESPTAGPYTVTITGFNVPMGDQPYALVTSGVVTPARFEVACGDTDGLTRAIEAANGNSAASIIHLNPLGQTDCIYTLTGVDNVTDGPNGLPSITSEITVDGNGATIKRGDTALEMRIFHLAAGGTVTLNELTVANGEISTADSCGGGIYNRGTLTLNNSTVNANHTDGDPCHGGGICNEGTLTVNNSTISGNSANNDGGGIANRNDGTLTVNHSTLSSNSAGNNGGAIRNGVNSTVTLKNSIVAGNVAYSTGPDCHNLATLTSLGYNLVGDDSDCPFTPQTGDQVNVAPLLDSLQLNPPGNTETHALLANSPAADAIPRDRCTDQQGAPVTTDQRGVSRPQGIACDIGAYELEHPLIYLPVVTR